MANGRRRISEAKSYPGHGPIRPDWPKSPEFRDLYMDGGKAAQITGRLLKKYDKRLAAAEKKKCG